MRGRKPTPERLRLTGTPHTLGDRPQGVVPDKPDFLEGDASKEWDRLVPELASAGYISEVDAMMLAGYCVQFALWRKAMKQVADEGITQDSPTGTRVNPAVKVMEGAACEMRRIADEFGFTPAARSRIRVGGTGGGGEGDDFEEFQSGAGPRLANANEVG